jgi:hypothetical protein
VEEPADRWVPALGLHIGLRSQDGSASTRTSDVLGPAFDPGPQRVRPGSNGEAALLGATFLASLEVTTPSLKMTGAPALFAHVGIGGVLGSTDNIAREGSPDELAPPPNSNLFDEIDILGQGSEAQVQVQSLIVRAGAGLSITVPLENRTLRIKPSIEYIREEIQLTGLTHRAVGQVAPLRNFSEARLIMLRDEDTKEFHGIGPGIEFETDAIRANDFVWTFFAGGQAYYFPGDLEIDLSDSNEFAESASWSYEKEEWGFHVGVGMRFRWLPQ